MSEYYFEAAFDTVSDLVSIISEDNVILKVNKAITEKLNQPEGALRGKLCHKIFFNYDEPCVECPLNECKKKLKQISKTHLDNYILTLSPIFNNHPEPIGYVHILKDISEINKIKYGIRLGEILVNDKYLSFEQLNEILKIRNKKIGEIVIELGLIDEHILTKALEKQKELNNNDEYI